MNTSRAQWMLSLLPAVFAESDAQSDGTLTRLLEVLGAVFFDGNEDPHKPNTKVTLPGLERQIRTVPGVFLPHGDPIDTRPGNVGHTPNHLLPWLAEWLSFAPHEYLDPPALRRVLANIVPLNGLRGTRGYLERLLELAFATQLSDIAVDDRPQQGFRIGSSEVGRNTRLASGLPYFFSVTVRLRAGVSKADLRPRLCAVIDYARPAHTSYELIINTSAAVERV